MLRRNKDAIANVVYGMLGHTIEADDVGQNVFIRFFNNIDQSYLIFLTFLLVYLKDSLSCLLYYYKRLFYNIK